MKNSNRTITIWVMKDRTAEPIQYRVSVTAIKRAAVLAIGLPAVLIGLLIGTGARCSLLARGNSRLSEIAAQYRCSGDQLLSLENRLSRLEAQENRGREQLRYLAVEVKKELKHLAPEGAVGGGTEIEFGEPRESPRARSFSQIKKMTELNRRMAALDERLKGDEWASSELDHVLDEHKALISCLPSIWPVAKGALTSRFGPRIHPITGELQMHEGIDITAPAGTLIHAAAPGMVTLADRQSEYGLSVEISHGYGFSTFYAHCLALLVQPGQMVKAGQPIAELGSTGFSTGPHLHLEVRLAGIPVDPLRYLSVFSEGPDGK